MDRAAEIFMLSAGRWRRRALWSRACRSTRKKCARTSTSQRSDHVGSGDDGAQAPRWAQRAHDVVYDICREVVRTGKPLIDLLEKDKEIRKHADRKTLEEARRSRQLSRVAGEMVDAC